jgi:hypothetical protein
MLEGLTQVRRDFIVGSDFSGYANLDERLVSVDKEPQEEFFGRLPERTG